MTDERQGHPSCSILERLHHCPGSWELSKSAPPQEETEDAASGTRIHDVLAGLKPESILSEDELWCHKLCVATREVALKQCDIEPVGSFVERRLWRRAGDVTLSGKADIIEFASESGPTIITDYKTGRNETESAKGNRQLAGLVACAVAEWPALADSKFFTVIIAPRQRNTLSIALYDGYDAIQGAVDETERTVRLALKPHAPRKTGDHCQYCPAKAICPEHQAMGGMALKTLSGELSAPTKVDMASAAQNLSNGQLGALMEDYWRREWANEAILAEVRRRLTNGEVMDGFCLEPGETRTKIVDVMGLYARLQDKVSSEQFCKAASMTKTALEPLVKEAYGVKGKDLKAKMAELLDGLTEQTTTKPSVVRMRKEIE